MCIKQNWFGLRIYIVRNINVFTIFSTQKSNVDDFNSGLNQNLVNRWICQGHCNFSMYLRLNKLEFSKKVPILSDIFLIISFNIKWPLNWLIKKKNVQIHEKENLNVFETQTENRIILTTLILWKIFKYNVQVQIKSYNNFR